MTQANRKPKNSVPFSLRLTFEEKAYLEKQAEGMPLSTYAKTRLFGEAVQPRKTRGKSPVKDHQALAQVLACLGTSRLAHNIGDLAEAMDKGYFYHGEEAEAVVSRAVQDIAAMRALLMKALGMKAEMVERESITQRFNRAACSQKVTPKNEIRLSL